MALSGTITGSCDNSHYTLTCEWSATQNTSANTSTITANVYLNGNGYSTQSSYWCCTINGTQVTTNWSGTVSGKTKLGSRSWTVSHNSDGTCSTSISFSYSNRVTAGTYTTNKGSGSSNVTLNAIPRASSFSLNRTSGTFGSDQFTISISRASSSFTHTITYKLGSINWVGADKTTSTSFSFTPAIGDCQQLPNATSGTATIIVDTYSGTTKIGSASKTVTLYVPSSVVPSVGISITANNTLSGHNVASRTTFTVKPTNASGSYGSTIKSYQITGGGLNSSSSGGATSKALGAGSYTFTVKVTDSRGRTASASASRTVNAYSNPSLNASFYRCDSSGNKVANGTYCKISASWNVTNVADKNVNIKQYKLTYKKRADSSWLLWKDWTDIGNYSGSGVVIDYGSGWSATTTYDVRMHLKDSYNEISVGGTLNTQSALLNLEKSGVGIGKIWEQGALDVGGAVFINGYTKISGNGKAIQIGTGETDVYIHNTSSGKYLQLKDDGNLRYSDNFIFHSGNVNGSSSNRWHGTPPIIGGDGCMEIGKYLDFHHTKDGGEDYSVRLCVDANNKNVVYLPNDTGRLYNTGNHGCKRLAQGAWYMTGSQSIGLSDTIWNQSHGIILVFSAYNPSSGQTYQFDWHTYFVPKSFYTDRESAEGYALITIFLTNPTLSNIGTKHLRVYNNKITGDDRNIQTGSGSGISFKNNEWVLRYVYGI